MGKIMPGKIILTVDVEDYFQVEAFTPYIERKSWHNFHSRVVENTNRLLDIFGSYGAYGTFFVLGWVAEKCPSLVKSIHDAGHEVASHGFDHKMVTSMHPEEFRSDIRKTKDILENLTGSPVFGYRAPTFSILDETKWAYDVLLSEGYRYSSSVYPIWHDRYGWPDFGVFPRVMASNGNVRVWEIPLSVANLGFVKIPFGGGGYLRTYPLSITLAFFRGILRKNQNAIVYLHPWELDEEHPSVKAPLLARIRHFQGIRGMERKIRMILDRFESSPVRNIPLIQSEAI